METPPSDEPPAAAEVAVEAAVLLELEPPQAASAPAAPTAPATFRKSRREINFFIVSSFCYAFSKTGWHVRTIRCSCLLFYKETQKKSILFGQIFEKIFQTKNSEQKSFQNRVYRCFSSSTSAISRRVSSTLSSWRRDTSVNRVSIKNSWAMRAGTEPSCRGPSFAPHCRMTLA